MRISFLILVCCLSAMQSLAQRNNVVDALDSTAQALANQGKWDSALAVMYKLNALQPFNAVYIHNTACIHASKGNVDSAFQYLYQIGDSLSYMLNLSDPDFYPLISSPSWASLENRYFNSKPVRAIVKDSAFARILLRMQIKDQAYYSEINIEETQAKPNKEKIKKLWSKKEALNKENLMDLEELVQTKGWPGFSKVGFRFSNTAFLVVQHSDYVTMKKYYHYIKTACETGEGNCGAQALLYDRIKVNEGKAQRYGSQVHLDENTKKYSLYPLEDTALVNEYREYMGLGLLEEYIKNWEIDLKIPKRKNPLAYVDSVIYYQDSGGDPQYPYPHGCFVNDHKIMPLDPSQIKGKNNSVALVMPIGSTVILQFMDNQIVNYPYQPDIFIKEEGVAGDKAITYVSNDGVKFDSLGITIGGRTSALDLEAINYTSPVKFIKLVSLNNNGSLPGFDLVHVKGTPMSSVPASYTRKDIEKYIERALKDEIISAPPNKTVVPEIKAIYFETGKYLISDSARLLLQTIVSKLKGDLTCKIELNGYTDDVGTAQANDALSLRRALEVANYLIDHGISQRHIFTFGNSNTGSVQENKTEQIRAKNRRVELKFFY